MSNREGVAVGACYLTADHEVRYVVEVAGDQVVFEARGSRHKPFPWAARAPLSKQRFMREVVAEIPKDWDPRFPQAGKAK